MPTKERPLREGYQGAREIEKRGYQGSGPRPANPTPPNVGSAAVTPVVQQQESTTTSQTTGTQNT